MNAKFALELYLSKDTTLISRHIALLKAVGETKSITKAAQKIGISYKNCWDSLNLINNASKKPLISRAQGSKKNSGSELTDYAKSLIRSYDIISRVGDSFLEQILKADDISDENLIGLERIGIKLSARNQLNAVISEISRGAVDSIITLTLSGGEKLDAQITIESEKNLELRPGKEVLLIFKAPSVKILKGENLGECNGVKCKISDVKIGIKNAQICLDTAGHQNIIAIIARKSANELNLGVGDEVMACIEPDDIIIGV
ncbi:TOBE domain-containing protein [Campylobacter sp. JMF_06 NA1]|uniref:TOBE domain-containing protein n=1 Tax=Campylobacter sp. JMF_06 NA1 TaxID=2983823 RepID=UPI0022E9A750|nr:TOBE domain-containing protein [Campylobacter sp. JMF_06 NA1]MDA3077853.1 TOBE domain-containing protein [Campylobacter sp. JMF_06 NA1]